MITPLDVVDVPRLADTRYGQNPRKVGGQRRVVRKPAQIALEQTVIGSIEAHQCHEQSHVRLGQAVAEQERSTPADVLFQLVEHGEHIGERLFISYLSGGEAGTIDAVVEPCIDAVVECVNVRAKLLRVEIKCSASQRAETRVEHPQ